MTAWRGLGETCAFQSTPPVKAATAQHEVFAELVAISIHAAREGGDSEAFALTYFQIGFQSTPPVKAATPALQYAAVALAISIHAAREGGDCRALVHAQHVPISIHAAREGGDLPFARSFPPPTAFQSTPPVKAATFAFRFKCGYGFDFNPRRP